MTPDDPLLISELRRDEGVKYLPYHDTVGILTVGVGHNLKAKPLPVGWCYPLSDAQVNQLLAEDLQTVFDGLDNELPWWRKLDYARQRAIVNFVFNVGIGTALKFKRTFGLWASGNYEAASIAILESKWAKQVGNRAVRISKMIKEGSDKVSLT